MQLDLTRFANNTVKVHTNEKDITHKIDISTNLFLN